jgi:hypothetical protein
VSGPAFLNTDYGSLGPLYGLTKVCAQDAPTFKAMLPDAIAERDKRALAYAEAERECSDLSQSFGDLTRRLADAQSNLNLELSRTWTEVQQNPNAADIRGLAACLLPAEREAALINDVLDILHHVLIPAAILRKMEQLEKLRQADALEWGLHAAHDEAETLLRMEAAGVQGGLFVGDTTQRLKRAASEATRQAQVAQVELDAERERQTMAKQQRHTNGGITRAEAVSMSLELSRSVTKEDLNV